MRWLADQQIYIHPMQTYDIINCQEFWVLQVISIGQMQIQMQAQTRIKAYFQKQKCQDSSQQQQSFQCDFNVYFEKKYNEEVVQKNQIAGHRNKSNKYFDMPKQVHNDYHQKAKKQNRQLQNRPLIRQLFKKECPKFKTSVTQLSSITHQTDLDTLRKSHGSQQRAEDYVCSQQDTNRSSQRKVISSIRKSHQKVKPKQLISIFNQQVITEATFKPRHLKTEGQVTANYNNIKKLLQQKLGKDFIKPRNKNINIATNRILNQKDFLLLKEKQNFNPNLKRKDSFEKLNVVKQKPIKSKVFKVDAQTTYQRLLNEIYNKNPKKQGTLKCEKFSKTIQLKSLNCVQNKTLQVEKPKKPKQERAIKRQNSEPVLKTQNNNNMQNQKRQLKWLNLTFEQRQRKNLDNKKIKQEHWKGIRTSLQTKQCTFKPKLQSTGKNIKFYESLRRHQSYSQIHRNKLIK